MPRLRSKALVWIVRQGAAGHEVLLLQRPERRGGGFHPVTGKAEDGEPIADAAAREALEETRLSGQLVDLGYEHQYVSATGKRFRERAFLHGHSFCGNPLGAAVAREVLAVMREEDVLGQVARKAPRLRSAVEEVAPPRSGARGDFVACASRGARARTDALRG